MVRLAPPEIRPMIRLHRTAAVLAALAAAPAALAQPGDLLDQTRRLQAVASQQVEADIRLGLSEASRLADKDQAVVKYKQLLQRVEEDKNLSEDRKATLKAHPERSHSHRGGSRDCGRG